MNHTNGSRQNVKILILWAQLTVRLGDKEQKHFYDLLKCKANENNNQKLESQL